jgi:transposase
MSRRVRTRRWGSIRPWSGPISTPPARGMLRPPRPSQGAGSNDKNLGPSPDPGPDREGLGRSRGGLTTKVHLAADRLARPIARVTTPGQRHDAVMFTAVLAAIHIARPGRGRPRTRPGHVLADKAYSSKAIRGLLRRRAIAATIPEKADQKAHRARRGSTGGRPPGFDAERYKQRNTAERAINKLKGHRGFATRYDKREDIYQGTIDVATIRIWLRSPEQDLRDRP